MNPSLSTADTHGHACPLCHARGTSLFSAPALRLFKSAVIGHELAEPATLGELAQGEPGLLRRLASNSMLRLLFGTLIAMLLVNINESALGALARFLSGLASLSSQGARDAASWPYSHAILNLIGYLLLFRCLVEAGDCLLHGDPETHIKYHREFELDKLRESASPWRGCPRCKLLWHSESPTLALPWSAKSMRAAIAGGAAFCDWEASQLLGQPSSFNPVPKRATRRL